MNRIQNEHLLSMLERENGSIQIGNSVLFTRVSIFNYQRGFGRKRIMTNLLKHKLPNWDTKQTDTFQILQEFHYLGQINKIRRIEKHRSNFTLLVCHQDQMENWIRRLDQENLQTVRLHRKQKLEFNKNESKIFIITLPCLSYYLESYFQNISFMRVIIVDPWFLDFPNLSQFNIYYGFCWILCTELANLYNFKKNHFIFNILPREIDLITLQSLLLCKNLRIQETLKNTFSLPSYTLIKHHSREQMYEIMKGNIDADIFKCLHSGKISTAIQKLNSISSNSPHTWEFIEMKNKEQLVRKRLLLQTYLSDKPKDIYQNSRNQLISQLYQEIHSLEEKTLTLQIKKEEYKTINECKICFESLDDHQEPIFLDCCFNLICASCIIKCLQSKKECPYCRHILYNDDLISFHTHVAPYSETSLLPMKSKFDTAIDIIERSNGKVVFLLVSSNRMIEQTLKYAAGKNLHCIDFCGNIHERKEIYSNHQETPYDIIICSDYRYLFDFHFDNVSEVIAFDFFPKIIYKYICSRFYNYQRKIPLQYHTFLFFC